MIDEKRLEKLKREVLLANLSLVRHNLVMFTWGNASGIDREAGVVVIKPSGVEYDALTAENLSVVRLSDGAHISGGKPSSDTPTHLYLYRKYREIGGVVHTHSRFATVFAQACRGISALGTTHADYFRGEVVCTRRMTAEEIGGEYEAETGKLISEAIEGDCMRVPAALVACHGPFCWGENAAFAAENAAVLEETAFLAWHTEVICSDIRPISGELLDRHYLRKHGDGAYYGQ